MVPLLTESLNVHHHTAIDYKSNFETLENLVLIGGPDDGVITPWQSRYMYIHYIFQ